MFCGIVGCLIATSFIMQTYSTHGLSTSENFYRAKLEMYVVDCIWTTTVTILSAVSE